LPLAPVAADPPSDPLPLRRVLIAPQDVPAQLERARKDILVQMPLEDFEAKVQQAARAGAVPQRPRLVKARYWAELEGTTLVGRGDWTVINPAPAGGLLPLTDLRLPLQNVKVEGAEAILGDLDGKTPGLWLAKPGPQTVTFDWSLRARVEVGKLHFDLQAPACAAASLELTLPAAFVVTLQGGAAVLSGPDFAGKPDRQLWRIGFAGRPDRPQLSLVLRRASGPEAIPPLILASAVVRQQLLPDRLLAEYTLDLEVLHSPVQELILDYDPRLRPMEVKCLELPPKDWEILPPAKEQPGQGMKGAALVVRWREPIQDMVPKLLIVCQAPLPADGPWTSPALRVRSAVPRGETLELRIHPDVELQDWRPGDFRLLRTATDAEGAQLLTLTDGEASAAARPSARVRAGQPEVAAWQTAWWRIGPRGSSLTAEVRYEVLHGRLFQLALQLRPGGKDGWQVEGVELVEPRNMLRNWVTTTDKDRRVLLVELQRGLGTGQQARLIVRLRSAANRAAPAGPGLSFPQIIPLEKGPQAGELGISVDPLYRVTTIKASVTPTVSEKAGPWGKASLQLFYTYRGEPLAGQLHLLPHRPVIHAACRTELLLAPQGATVRATLTLDPVVGEPEAVDLYVTAPGGGRWKWGAAGKAHAARGLERLPLQGALPALLALPGDSPLVAATALIGRPPGTFWRLSLTRPLSQRQTVTLEMPLEPARHIPARTGLLDEWEIPLVTVPGADRLDGEAILQLTGVELVEVQAQGLQETEAGATAARSSAVADGWHAFRFGQLAPAQLPRLSLRTRLLPAAPSQQELCDASRLTTRVEPDGRLVHHFAFRLLGWRTRELPVQLPPGARFLAARVEGRWVERLPPIKEDGRGLTIKLPVTDGPAAHHFEVLYQLGESGPGWLPWTCLEAPAPQLPVKPLALRRTWLLPPGITPLWAGVQRLPDAGGPAGEDLWEATLRKGWGAGQTLLVDAAGPLLARENWAAAQQRRLEQAAAALPGRPEAERDWQLGPALERLVLDHLQGAFPLVVDAEAVRAAGLGPETPCSARSKSAPSSPPAPFWEGLGLVYVPCRSGALLTTRQQWQEWHGLRGETRLEDDAIDEAVRQAARDGQDRSGRFRAALAWSRSAEVGLPDNPFQEALGAGWTRWEPVAGSESPDGLVVIHQGGVLAVGVALAAVLSLVIWRAREVLSHRGCVRLLLAWLTLAALGIVWLPGPLRGAVWPPALAGLVLAFVWYLRRQRPEKRGQDRGSALRGAAAAVVLIVLVAAPWPGAPAGAPEPDTVLILPGPADAPGRQAVLVTQDLLKRLDALARRGPAVPVEAALLSARYKGVVTGGLADFEADFQVYCASDRAVARVPLGGVDLKEGALLEGEFIYPTALSGPQAGYAVRITGRKGQVVKLTLPFRARVKSAGDSHGFTFTIPRLVQSQLELGLPVDAVRAQAVTALGQQQVESAKAGEAPRLRASLGLADLGRTDKTSAVQVRWQQGQRPGPAPSVQIGEYYLWDLRPHQGESRPPAARLTAVLKYVVSGGPLSELAIDLPGDMLARGVEVVPQELLPLPRTQARLATWKLAPPKGSKRRLTLKLAEPVTGSLLVRLTLVPRLGVGPGTQLLTLPTPVQPAPGTEKSPTGLLAYRLEGLEAADRPHHLGVINIPFAQFAREWLELGAGREALGTADPERRAGRAYSFRRTQPGAALELILTAPPPSATAVTTWRVFPGHADFEVTARLAAPAAEGATPASMLTLVEWDIPAQVTVAQVSGPMVQRWSLSGGRLQVWLRERCQKTFVAVKGWTVLPAGASGQFLPPGVRLRAPRTTQAKVVVQAGPGVSLTEASLDNLRQLAGSAPLTYSVPDPARPYAAAFRVRPAAVTAEVRCLTTVETRAEAARFRTLLSLERPPGQLRTLTLHLRRWPGAGVHLEAPSLEARELPHGRAGERTWAVTLPSAGSLHYSLTLTGEQPLQADRKVAMPEVSVSGAVLKASWLAGLGADLRAVEARGVATVKDVMVELGQWPAEAELIRREGMAWKVQAGDWRLVLAPRTQAKSPAVTVLLTELKAAVVDGAHWLHEAVYTLATDGAADLRVQLPTGAQVLTVALDGSPVASRPTDPHLLWLPLPASPGIHTLRVSWRFEEGRESLARPQLQGPRLQETGDQPVLWTVYVPAGYHLARSAAELGGAAISTVRLDLERAAAQLRLCELLAEHHRVQLGAEADAHLLAAQQRFAWCCRRAEGRLLEDPRAAAEVGPAGVALPDWLRQLRRRNQDLAQKYGLARLRGAADKVPPASAAGPLLALAADRGTPTYWRTATAERPPVLHLQADAARQAGEALVASELLLGLLVCIWILSHLRRLAGWLCRLWPEQLLLLAVLGWQAFGPSLVGVALVLLALCGRLLALGRWLQGCLHRRDPATLSSGSGVSST
jgi:hypothetical protein